MKRTDNVNIKDLNTFCIACEADSLIVIDSRETLEQAIRSFDFTKSKFFVLGEGSNTLFGSSFSGVILKDELKGKEILREDQDHIYIKVGSGEIWRELVTEMSEREYSGIENMAFIPGTVGAAVVQNLGAYGQVIEDVVDEVEVIDLRNGEKKVFKNRECDFAYRNSVFKKAEMRPFFVVSVTIKLNKYNSFDTSYHSRYSNESLQKWLAENAKEPYKPIDIVNAVTELRRYKLPWIDEYGTCGSFFVNPFVTKEKYEELVKKIPDLQCYPITKMDYSKDSPDELVEDLVKIPAGRLLDELGWKDKWIGNVGTFERHALCVVSNKKATAQEIRDFVIEMQKDVEDEFGIKLRAEVVIVD